jgi:hypothetical protein
MSSRPSKGEKQTITIMQLRLHENFVKTTIVALLANLYLAHQTLGAVGGIGDFDFPALHSVSTNVDGMVLTLEFADVSVIAGERLKGRMVVSNALEPVGKREGGANERIVSWTSGAERGYLDTAIGQFVVLNDEGAPLPKTFWVPEEYFSNASGRGSSISPGESMAFPGDLVKKYSLTNPGIYLVKAVASMPVPPTNDWRKQMIIETPFLSLTVLGRLASMPPPEQLHTQQELAMTPKDRDPPQLMVTHPKLERPPHVPRVAPRDTWTPPVPKGVENQLANGATSAKKEVQFPSRGILLGLIAVLLSGGLVLYLVWSRRKHGHP